MKMRQDIWTEKKEISKHIHFKSYCQASFHGSKMKCKYLSKKRASEEVCMSPWAFIFRVSQEFMEIFF